MSRTFNDLSYLGFFYFGSFTFSSIERDDCICDKFLFRFRIIVTVDYLSALPEITQVLIAYRTEPVTTSLRKYLL